MGVSASPPRPPSRNLHEINPDRATHSMAQRDSSRSNSNSSSTRSVGGLVDPSSYPGYIPGYFSRSSGSYATATTRAGKAIPSATDRALPPISSSAKFAKASGRPQSRGGEHYVPSKPRNHGSDARHVGKEPTTIMIERNAGQFIDNETIYSRFPYLKRPDHARWQRYGISGSRKCEEQPQHTSDNAHGHPPLEDADDETIYRRYPHLKKVATLNDDVEKRLELPPPEPPVSPPQSQQQNTTDNNRRTRRTTLNVRWKSDVFDEGESSQKDLSELDESERHKRLSYGYRLQPDISDIISDIGSRRTSENNGDGSDDDDDGQPQTIYKRGASVPSNPAQESPVNNPNDHGNKSDKRTYSSPTFSDHSLLGQESANGSREFNLSALSFIAGLQDAVGHDSDDDEGRVRTS